MIVIGEKINATLKSVKEIFRSRDEERLVDLAARQAKAGAGFIDINVGTGIGTRQDELDAVKWAIRTVQENIRADICIDSADAGVIEAGLSVCRTDRVMINSVKAESGILSAVLPLAAEHDALLVALAMDETGIPTTVENRLKACGAIAKAAESHRFHLENIYFDPLVMPVSTNIESGKVTLDTLKEIKRTFAGAKTVTGLSNVSFGLPDRGRLNAAFLHMCIYAGLDAAILDPTDEALMSAVKTGEVLVGKDRHCRRYTRAFRKNPK